jgi:hypothetical protein
MGHGGPIRIEKSIRFNCIGLWVEVSVFRSLKLVLRRLQSPRHIGDCEGPDIVQSLYRHNNLLVLVRYTVKKFTDDLLRDSFPEHGQMLDHAAQAH